MNKLPDGFQEWTGAVATSNTLNGFQEWTGGDLAGPAKAESPRQPSSAEQSQTRKPASVDEFVQQISPIAQRIAQKIGAPVEAVIGQLGLETGWGKSVIPGTNNYGNIKDMSGGGVAATDNMTGSRDRYRQYATPEEFADDYAKLVGTNPRYKGAVGAKDAQGFFTGLKQGGYAEDPNYVQSGVAASRMAGDALKRSQPAPAEQALPDLATVPKWRDIAASEKFKSHSEAEQIQKKNEYFDQVIAPHIAASGLDVAAEKSKFMKTDFSSKTMAETIKDAGKNLATQAVESAWKVISNMNPFAEKHGLMEGVSQTEKQENTARFNLPLSAKARAKLDYQYNIATPEQRNALSKADGVVGMYFTDRNKQHENRDSHTQFLSELFFSSDSTDIADPRLEARTRQLIRSGMTAEGANTYARTEMRLGMNPGGIKPGSAAESSFDFELQDRFKNAPAIIRGAVKGYQGYKQGSLGILQAASDVIGADEASSRFAKGASEAQGVIDAVGENKNKAGEMFEGAITSISQQMPMLIGGAVTGSEAIVLGSMAVQSFGQEYAQGRSQNLSGDDAAKRASLFAAFEVIGEKFGLGNTLKALRMSASGAQTKDLAMELSKALIKEIPGEVITTTGQFATDKVNSFGLNKEAGMADYISQVGDTIGQTVMQSALMLGGTGGVSATVRHLRNRSNNDTVVSEAYANDARDRALSKWERSPLVRSRETPQADNQSPQVPPLPPQAHPTSEVADAVVRDLAAAAGMDVESLIPAKTLPPPAVAADPVAHPAQPQADGGIADQSTSAESRELALWLKSSDVGLTPDEQAELDSYQNATAQEQPQNGIEQRPAASPDVATQANDVQSADVQRSDGDQRRDMGEGQRPNPNAEASLSSAGEDLAIRDEGSGVQALNPSDNPQQESSSELTPIEAQQAEAQGFEPQQVQADAAPGIAPWPSPAQPVKQAPSRAVPDDLLGMLNASGGISSSIKSDIDQDAKGRPGLYRPAGRNIDEIGALMVEHGYLTPVEAGDSNVVMGMLRRAVGGERIMTAQGIERAQQKEEEARHRAGLVAKAIELGVNPRGKSIAKLESAIQQEIARRESAFDARQQALIQESADAEQAIEDVLALFGAGSPSFQWMVDKFVEISERENADHRKSGYDSLVRAARQALRKWQADNARVEAVIEQSLEDGYGSTENPFGPSEGFAGETEPGAAAEGARPGSVQSSDGRGQGFALETQTEQTLAEKVARENDQSLADKQTADAQREGFTLSTQQAEESRSEDTADLFGKVSSSDIQKGREIERDMQLARGQVAPADLFSDPESKPNQETESSIGNGSGHIGDATEMVNQERTAQETQPARAETPAKRPESARAEQESSAEMDALKAEMGQAIGELASILNVKMNLTPEEESRIIPVMSKIFRIAAKMGYVKFKDAARHVIGQIRQIGGDELANKLSIDNLQAGYINIAKEIGGDKREALAYDSIEELESEGASNEPVQRSNTDLERDSQDADTADGMGAQGVRAGRRGDDGAGEQGVRQTETSRRPDGGVSVPGHETAPAGELGDYEVLREQAGTEERASGSADRSGSGLVGYDGPPIEPDATGAIAKAATSGSQVERNREAQRSADKNANTGGTLGDIRSALPSLLPGQQEDVFKAEQRFSKPDGYGMLFTNGTGTGKTFTGLGVIKRFSNRGQHNILIAAPSDQVIAAWISSGRHLGLTITQLADTNDAGNGIVITTYANLGDNAALASRQWDLVVADEAHKMMQSEDGKVTNALQSLRAISYHPGGIWRRMDMVHADLNQQISEASEKLEAIKSAKGYATNAQAKLDGLLAELKKKQDAMKAEFAAKQGEARSRALFLSATPFAYEKAIDWAEGYLFNYGPEVDSSAYNSGGNYERFMMQHFGYRMRNNKLTQPEGAVDSGRMQRQFNTWLKSQGVLSGRMLEVEPDYDRRFIMVESAIGHRIDDALEWIRETKLDGARELQEKVRDQFDYQSRRYLLEAVKANEVIEHVKEHMALGRKVVVFHDYKKGGAFHPFRFNANTAAENEFNAKFADLVRFDFDALGAPIETFKRELPGVLLFNGSESAKNRRAAVAKFQDDASGPQVILVQTDAGKEGISLHDTTGKHQRVLFNLGQPTAPTTAIQQEGRIYRTGQATDAIMRYLTTGTDWEKWAFATTIATRASAAENLGMGEAARALKDAFITAYEEADDYRAGHEDEGKGGKERDKLANEALTQFDRARSFYFGQQKKTSKTKAAEGADYFATPEPLGLKMVEWADLRSGEDALEPSAGHGAIARWLPDHTNRTAIEPSGKLLPRLAMVFDGKMEQADFESLHINNKYDAIVMNPPFGSGGRTAVDHVAKAATHLRDGGRIVALIPTGPAADAKFEKWFNSVEQVKIKAPITVEGVGDVFIGDTVKTRATWAPEGRVTGVDRDKGTLMVQTKPGSSSMVTRQSVTDVQPTGKRTREVRPAADLYLAADIHLPSVTFERAGTSVMTRVVVIEKQTNKELAEKIQQQSRDYSSAEDIGEFFDRIENADLAPRVKPHAIDEEQSKADARPDKAAPKIDEAKQIERGDAQIVEHVTGKGKKITGIVRKDLTLAQAKEIDPYTFKKDGGFFIRDKYLKESSGPLFSLNQESKTPEQIARELFGNPNPKSTVDQITQELSGEGSLGSNIKVIQSALDLPANERRQVFQSSSSDIGLQAVFFPDSGRVYLIADNIEPGEALSALLHDGGVHAGLYGMLGERGINSLAAQIKDWSINSQDKEEGRIAKRALARIPENTSPEHINEEAVAYFVTEAVKAGHGDPKPAKSNAIARWFAKLWRMVESSIKKLGADPSKLTVDDVVALARGALERVKAGEIDPRRDENEKPLPKTITIDGKERPTTNSNGKQIHPTREGVENFWRWFGDSKVVDADGRPLVVYHGSPDLRFLKDDGAFKSKKERYGFGTESHAHWFTDSQRTAKTYADPHRAFDYQRAEEGVIEAYIRIENPLEVNASGEDWRTAQKRGQTSSVIDDATKAGNDGVIILNVRDDYQTRVVRGDKPVTTYTVFSPVQIKSATDNSGAFDGSNPSILASRSYSPEQDAFRKKAGIGNRPTIKQKLQRWADGMLGSLSWDAFRQGALDQFHGIKLAELRTVGMLPVEQSAYVTSRLATGASSVMAGLLGHGQARWAANGQHLEKIDGTKGLLDILKPVEGRLDDFLGWMVATRASRLMKEGRENNFTQADIQAGLSLANGNESLFLKVAKEFADFKRSVLDIAEQAGLIDPVGRQVWDHADWIPFYRQMQDEAVKGPGGKRGLSKQSSGIRQLKGGDSAINDPLENILMNFQHLIDASLKNNALRKVIGNVAGKTNSDEFLESVGYGMQGAIVSRDQIKKQLMAAGTPQQMIDALPSSALLGMAKMWALKAPEGKDIIRVMENGKPHFYRVTDPLLLKAVTSFEPFNIPGLATMRAFKRLLTRSVTATPAFMVRNFVRDWFSSAIISRDSTNIISAMRGAVKSFNQSGGYEQMLFAGASFAGGQTDGADPDATAKAIRRELRKKGFSAASADEFMASILDRPIRMWDAYSKIGESIENANRESMFEAAKKSGKSDTAAAFEALDLMDFRLRGSHAAYQLFADVIPFVNARVQGLYRLGRSNPKQVAMRGALLLLIPSVLLALANAGNDEYEELPDWDKDTYWHFFIGGHHFRLPKPFEVGVMFGTIPERMTRAMLGNDSPKKLASRIWFNIAEQFNLVQWPQFMKPAIEVAMNEDGFSKRAIETVADKSVIPSMRASYYTSDTMKALAGMAPSVSDATGMSPKRIQHLWNGYLGSVGAAALSVSDFAVRRFQGLPFQESMRRDEYPLLGVFYREDPAKNSGYVEEIYKMAKDASELRKSYEMAMKSGRTDYAKRIFDDNKDKINMAGALDHSASQLSQSSKKIEAIRKDPDLSSDEKREQIDAVIQRRNDIAEKAAKRAIKAWGGSI